MKISVRWQVQPVADPLEAPWRAWRETGHRGAVLDAVRIYRPAIPWFGDALEDAVTWWSRSASTGKQRGRHSRAVTARRQQVRDLKLEAFYLMQCANGRTPDEAKAITAEWFRCHERTIGNVLARVKGLTPAERYLGPDDRADQWWVRLFTGPHATEELCRLRDLSEQYRPRPKTR